MLHGLLWEHCSGRPPRRGDLKDKEVSKVFDFSKYLINYKQIRLDSVASLKICDLCDG